VDELFGIPLDQIMVALLVLLGGILLVLAWIAGRHLLLVRMGIRNALRRPAQTALIVVGLMLSTLIMSAAFATGDTVSWSVTNEVYDRLRGVDFVLAARTDPANPTRDSSLSDRTLGRLRRDFADDPTFDGFAGVVRGTVPVLNVARRLAEPGADLAGISSGIEPFDAVRDVGGAVPPPLAAEDAYITDRLARKIDARVGSDIVVFVNNRPQTLHVTAVVRETAATAPRGSLGPGAGGDPPGGVVVALPTARRLLDRNGYSALLVSTTGGVRDSLAMRDHSVEERLRAYLNERPDTNAEVRTTKEALVGIAQLVGSLFVTFFLVFGLFSIAAGVMLIFLIFVMLAAERRSEMGMARAVGMTRMQLTESFLAEGMAYNLGSAAIGAPLGLGVAAGLVAVLSRIAGTFGFAITFHFNPRAFVVAYSLGVVLTFATVAIAAYRAAFVNIVRAIRDLPDPQPLRGRDRSLRRLVLAVAAVPWVLAWLVLAALWVLALGAGFALGLTTYGAGFALVAVLAAAYVWGLLRVGRRRGGLATVAYVGWWVLFNALALLSWALFRTRAWSARHRNAGGWAIWMLILGAVLTWLGGWVWHQAFAYRGGQTLIVLALTMLAVYLGARERATFTIGGLAVLWYWLLPLPFSLFREVQVDDLGLVEAFARILGLPAPRIDASIEMFFVAGISITAAGTLVVVFNAQLLVAVVAHLGRVFRGIAPALKTAIAYPLAAKFRTGMTLAMFALVVFSLVVMSTLNSNFSQLFAGEDATAGFDVVARANPSNRIPDLQAALDRVGYAGPKPAGIGALLVANRGTSTAAEATDTTSAGPVRLLGADDAFLALAALPLQHRARGYANDAEVIAALRRGEPVAIVDATLLAAASAGGGPFGSGGANPAGGPPPFAFTPDTSEALRRDAGFEPVTLTLANRRTRQPVEVRVIGVLQPQVAGVITDLAGIITPRAIVDRISRGGDTELFMVDAARGASRAMQRDLANGIESTLLERGVQADAIRDVIEDRSRLSTAFQYLFEGFMALGLVVGIAALGVIAFRTVVERRQQIGMLRAIGYTRGLVALSFFLESSFIALAGIGLGLFLGTALSYNLLTSPEFTNGTAVRFTVPWGRIGLVALVAYGASALMTILPARAASRVPVAEALRYE